MASEHQSIAGHVQVINHHELARDLHADQQYFIIDCRPVFAYNVCHISGAINEGKAKFQSSVGGATVVYDDSSGDMKDLSATHPLVLVMSALMGMGKCYLLRVVIEAQAEASPVNEGTVVWSQEKECLGEIFETFGPVKNPFYSLLINSEQELGPSLAPGQLIYVVSNNQSLTSYVFTAELMKQRGCDASWRGDIEVPSEASVLRSGRVPGTKMTLSLRLSAEMQEHSDDDAECKSKKKDREDKPRKKDEKRDRLQKTSSVVYTSDPMMKAYFQGPSALSQGAPPPAMGMVPPVPYGYPPPPLQGNGFSHMANIKLTLLISLPKHTPVDPPPTLEATPPTILEDRTIPMAFLPTLSLGYLLFTLDPLIIKLLPMVTRGLRVATSLNDKVAELLGPPPQTNRWSIDEVIKLVIYLDNV
eukprot:Em0002g255a